MSGLTDHLHLYEYLHTHDLSNDVPLSLSFSPLLAGMHFVCAVRLRAVVDKIMSHGGIPFWLPHNSRRARN